MKRLFPKYKLQDSGQSLVEFAFVAPVIVIIMVSAFYIGQAILVAQMASDDIQKPTTQKKALANLVNAPVQGDLEGSTNFDSFQIVAGDGPYVPSLLVGTKSYSDPLLGTLTYSVAAPLNRPLLEPATDPGAIIRTTASSALGENRTCPSERAYVSHLYRTLLDREPNITPGHPERGWVDGWAQGMRANGTPWVIKSIVHSEEFQSKDHTPRQIVRRLYHAMHMRHTDPHYMDWSLMLDEGDSVDEVIDGMYWSAEYQGNIAAGLVPPCRTN